MQGGGLVLVLPGESRRHGGQAQGPLPSTPRPLVPTDYGGHSPLPKRPIVDAPAMCCHPSTPILPSCLLTGRVCDMPLLRPPLPHPRQACERARSSTAWLV